MGSNVRINCGVFVNPSKGAPITIGNDVLIGPYCVIRSGDHNYQVKDKLIRLQGHTREPIVLEDDVWLGASVVILKGNKIGKGSVIGAHSVVTKNIEEYSVAFGVPASIYKKRT